MSWLGDLVGGGSPAVPTPSDDQYMQAIIEQIARAAAQQKATEDARRAAEQQAAQQQQQQRQQQEQQQRQQAEQAAQRAEQERIAREQQLAEQRRQEQEQQQRTAEQARVQRLADLRTAATDSARGGIQSYFSERGANPSQYGTQIDQLIQQTLAGVDPNDESPSTKLNPTTLASPLYTDLESKRRGDVTGQVKALFGDNYGSTRIANTADDAILSSIEGGQFDTSRSLIENMLKRGVVTPTGADAAFASLESQRPTVQSNLDTVGSGALSIGRGKLDDIVNRALSGASTLSLGGSFDPSTFTTEADTAFNEFMGSLPDNLRKSAPGNLFNTKNLASIAGRSQGPQNTKFNPDALSGILDTGSPDQDQSTGTSRRPKNPNAAYVF